MCGGQPVCQRTVVCGATLATIIKADSGSEPELQGYFHMPGIVWECA